MKITILVTDIIFRFRLAAIPHHQPQFTWQMEVFSMVEVAAVLNRLGLIDAEAAGRLAQASTTIVPLDGFNTMTLTDIASVVEFAQPMVEPVSDEAREGYMLMVVGEASEDQLAEAGFVAVASGPVQ